MLETELPTVAETYAFTARSEVRSHPVFDSGFRRLSSQTGRLLSLLDGTEDPYWAQLIRHLRRIRFELAALPVPFNAPALDLVRAQAAVEVQYARCTALYPALASAVHATLDIAREVVTRDDGPLLARLVSLAEESALGRAAVVLCEARLIRVAEPILRSYPIFRHFAVVGPAQLRSLRCYDRLLCVGSARWFPSFITSAPRAPAIDFVHFRWTPGPIRPSPLFAVPLADTATADGGRTRGQESRRLSPVIVVGDAAPVEEDEPEWLGPDIAPAPGASLLQEIVHRAHAVNASGVQRHDLVRALPVALEGGRAVLLDAEDGATVLVLDLAERGKSRVRRIPTADVEEGMFVLLRAGGGGDYVLPVADSVLGRRAAECRKLQRDWKTRLRAEVETRGLFETSIALLEYGGVRAEEGNVRRWMWDRNIRPREYADFLAIMRLTGLDADVTRYWNTMALIDRAHIKAGQLIRGMLLEQVMKSDLAELERVGSMEFDLPGTGTGRMVACRVIKTASEPVVTSAANVGRPLNAGDGLWQ